MLRKYFLLQSSKSEYQVTQFHITNWDPQGKCSNPQTIISVVDEVYKVQRRTGNHPIVVHCRSAQPPPHTSLPIPVPTLSSSDTVSRSGMFCAIATTIDRCKNENVVDVFQVVKAQRIQKPGLVHTVVRDTTHCQSLNIIGRLSLLTGSVRVCV